MDKVDRTELVELRTAFDRLDGDGNGKLEKSDLVHAARKKLHHPRRKLELARYKQELLRKAKKDPHPSTLKDGFLGLLREIS